MTLHVERIAAPDARPDRWAFVLHGIYGAGRNWNSVFRRLVESRSDWGFYPVDLRGHGQSPALASPHTLEACVRDLSVLASTLDPAPTVIVGHSFGGKVALLYGDEAEHDVVQTWVVDSTPDAREPAGSAWGMLRVLREAPGPFADREAGIQAVRDHGYAEPVARWMSTNLVPRGDAFEWRLDPDQMEALLRDFFRTDAWPAVEHPYGPELHFIRGSESGILDEEARLRLTSTGLGTDRVHLHTLEGGHWLNADNPDGLVRLFAEHLPRD